MALISTATIPITLNHPRPVLAMPTSRDSGEWKKYAADAQRYNRETQIMIEKFYNDLHRNIEGFNLVGLDADLPSAGFPGRQFLATDTKKFYKDTGSSWISTTLT